MKKRFDFGKIDYVGEGKALNRVTVDMEYKEENEKKSVFLFPLLFGTLAALML